MKRERKAQGPDKIRQEDERPFEDADHDQFAALIILTNRAGKGPYLGLDLGPREHAHEPFLLSHGSTKRHTILCPAAPRNREPGSEVMMFRAKRTLFEPAYLKLYETGELARRVERALADLTDYTLCPRDCHVNRLADRFAVCKTGRYAVVSSHFAHFGEEDCLRGWSGSGTIFFT